MVLVVKREIEKFGPKYFRVVREEQKNSSIVYGVPHVEKKIGFRDRSGRFSSELTDLRFFSALDPIGVKTKTNQIRCRNETEASHTQL